MHKTLLYILFLVIAKTSFSQPLMKDSVNFYITVINDKKQSVEGVSIEQFNASKKTLIKTALTNNKGVAVFYNMAEGHHFFIISGVGFKTYKTSIYTFPIAATKQNYQTIQLQTDVASLQDVTIVGTRPLVQYVQGKVLINVDASVTNVGTSVLEVLEKSPGVMVDKNGTISLQAKTGVLVLIDDKPTYLSGTELTNLLSSMSSAQIDVIELMANPSAKYDANGNAGIINIKTKKNKQKGFNGSATVSAGQGFYPKTNNSLVINYRNGKFNAFLSYSMNWNKNFLDLYALRKYFNNAGQLLATLDQPTLFLGRSLNNTVKTGIDYYASEKTTVGFALTGINF